MEKTAVNFSYAITVNTAPVSIYAVRADGTRTLLSTFTTTGQHTFLAQTPYTEIEGDYSLLTGPLTTAAVIGGSTTAPGSTGGGSGAPGQDGKDGKDGLSAYELAVQQGYTGGLDEWLASLKGEPGQDGASPAADDVADALLPKISAELSYEGPSATANWNASYFQLGENYVPQDAALFELGYRVRFDALNSCTTDPVYLGIWERTATGDDWERRGVSLNTQVQGLSMDALWRFDPADVRLSGRPIRCCLLATREDGWRTDLTMGVRVADVSDTNTAIVLGASSWQKAPKYFLRAYKPVDLSGGPYAPASHVSDTTAHLTADEHSKLTALLQNGGSSGSGNSSSGNSSDGNHYGSGTNGTSLQIGEGAQASEIETVALGYQATASGTNSIAIGGRAEASKSNSLALGNSARAQGDNSIAIGQSASVSGNGSGIAIGRTAQSTGGLALGNYAEAAIHEIELKSTGSPGEGQGLAVRFVGADTDKASLSLGGKGGVIINDGEQEYKFTFAALAAAAAAAAEGGLIATTREVEMLNTPMGSSLRLDNIRRVYLNMGYSNNSPISKNGGFVVTGVKLLVMAGLWDMRIDDPQSWEPTISVNKITSSSLAKSLEQSPTDYPAEVQLYVTGKIVDIQEMWSDYWMLEIAFDKPIIVSITEFLALGSSAPFSTENCIPGDGFCYIYTTDRTVQRIYLFYTLIVKE